MALKRSFPFFIAFILLNTHYLWAQKDEAATTDTTSITVDTINAQYYADSAAEEEYGETKTKPTYKVNFNDSIHVKPFDKAKWEKITDGITYKEGEEKNEKKTKYKYNAPAAPFSIASQWVKILLIAILAAVVGYLLFLLVKDAGWNSQTDSGAAVMLFDSEGEDLPEMEALRKLLKEALAENNYKLAVRYYYRMMIRHLLDQGLIRWKKEKTNRHYLLEVRNHSLYADIKTATYLFENYWYGDLEPSSTDFDKAEILFKKLLNS